MCRDPCPSREGVQGRGQCGAEEEAEEGEDISRGPCENSDLKLQHGL